MPEQDASGSDTCGTCSWPSRETTHLICLECGIDYAAEPPQKLTANGLAVLRAALTEVDRLRALTSNEGTYRYDA